MKKAIILLLLCCTAAHCAFQCCTNGELLTPKGKCGTEPRRNMNCSQRSMVLRDVILDGNKVFTQDSPGFMFVEDPNSYCIGEMYKNASVPSEGTVAVAVVCFEYIPHDNEMETSGILTIFSSIFLTFTVMIYIFLPQLRDLQGLCYMCMCFSMALAFLSLGILQLNPSFIGEICTATGFLVYFWMMATFFWMNVICINMYRTVNDSSYMRRTERQQFFLYSCYAWGSTVAFLIIALITNFVKGDHVKPGIGSSSCWFSGRAQTWLYFYGPIAILITANIALFVLSSTRLWRDTRKYEVSKLDILKHKFLLSLKLFLVMGISWIFEIASFAHGESHIVWKIMDTFNCLQGLVIFIILVVLRRRAITGLAAENCCLFITRPLANKLSPADDVEDQQKLAEETIEVRLN